MLNNFDTYISSQCEVTSYVAPKRAGDPFKMIMALLSAETATCFLSQHNLLSQSFQMPASFTPSIRAFVQARTSVLRRTIPTHKSVDINRQHIPYFTADPKVSKLRYVDISRIASTNPLLSSSFPHNKKHYSAQFHQSNQSPSFGIAISPLAFPCLA